MCIISTICRIWFRSRWFRERASVCWFSPPHHVTRNAIIYLILRKTRVNNIPSCGGLPANRVYTNIKTPLYFRYTTYVRKSRTIQVKQRYYTQCWDWKNFKCTRYRYKKFFQDWGGISFSHVTKREIRKDTEKFLKVFKF